MARSSPVQRPLLVAIILAALASAATAQGPPWVYPDVSDTCDSSTFDDFPFAVSSILGSALSLLLSPPVGILGEFCSQLAISNLQSCAGELQIQDGCCGTSCATQLVIAKTSFDPSDPSGPSCFDQLVNALCYNSATISTTPSQNLKLSLFTTITRCTVYPAVCSAPPPPELPPLSSPPPALSPPPPSPQPPSPRPPPVNAPKPPHKQPRAKPPPPHKHMRGCPPAPPPPRKQHGV